MSIPIALFVYGTLKRNEPLHDFLTLDPANRYLGDHITKSRYKMYEDHYPIAIKQDDPSKGHPLKGEVFHLYLPTLILLDKLEAGFTRTILGNNSQFGSFQWYVWTHLIPPSFTPVNPKDGILDWHSKR